MNTVDKKVAPPASVSVTVARGKTILIDKKTYGPGSVLNVSEQDHAHFLRTGFIVDPNADVIEPGTGPVFGTVQGVVKVK